MPSEQPTLISVGLASYNRPELLARAITSIRNQSYTNIEILVSDNGSTCAELVTIIKKFAAEDERVKYFLHPQNKGTFSNFRFLLERANGEYFIWLADDDYWSEHFLTNILRSAKESGAALTYGKALVVDYELPIHEKTIKELSTTNQNWCALIRFLFFDTDSIIYGIFKTETGKKLSFLLKDWYFSKRTLQAFPFLAYNFPSYTFIYGLLASGGFFNASDEDTIHFVGGREPFKNRPRLTTQHVQLLFAYFSMHTQMMWRYIQASFAVKSISGVVMSPIAALYLLVRRLFVALRNRKNRTLNEHKTTR